MHSKEFRDAEACGRDVGKGGTLRLKRPTFKRDMVRWIGPGVPFLFKLRNRMGKMYFDVSEQKYESSLCSLDRPLLVNNI